MDGTLLTPQRAQIAAEQGGLPLPPSPSPLRRSPRFSGPLPPPLAPAAAPALRSAEEAEPETDNEEDNVPTRPATPENDHGNDEPSSVLASRIMRSHTNPSPPPQSPTDAPVGDKPWPFAAGDDVADSVSASPSGMPPVRGSPGPESAILSPVPRQTHELDAYLQSAEQHPDPGSVVSEPTGATPNPFLTPTTVLLPPSPSPAPSSGPAQDHVNTTDEEADIADSLIPSEMDSPMPSSSKLAAVHDANDDDDPQTPVRRSSRPRRSMLISSPLRPDTTPSPKKNKGKARADPGFDTTPRPKFDGPLREVSPMRAKYKSRPSRREVDSLSPGTMGLLNVIAKTPSPLPETAQAEDPLAFRFPQASDPPQSLVGRMPIRSPMRSPSPRRGQQSGPLKLNLPDDPTQTPARRVPMEEAIASGRRSPSKPLDFFAINIPPSDSPARRVPVGGASTPRPALPPSVFGQPFASPTRSRSVEPPSSSRPKMPFRSGSAEPSVMQLPFPLVPSTSRIHASIPEEDEPPQPPLSTTSSSTESHSQKSTLRQHTPSKIPRLKPYARPASSTNINKSRLPMRQVDLSAASASNIGKGTAPKLKLKPTVEVPTLKRKLSSLDQPPSPLKTRPLRPVPPSPTKPLKMKPRLIEDTPDIQTDLPTIRLGTPITDSPPTTAAEPSTIGPSTSLAPAGDISVRRTTRTRRAPVSVAGSDIFPKPPPPPAARVRKPPTVRTEANLFRGLTPSAWTSMTKTNTTKNEVYQTAKLEIEVVRKEGVRPDSPVMKVKTRSQKEEDARGLQRSQRAERRAQRGGALTPVEGEEDGKVTPVQNGEDDEEEGDIGSPSPLRHRRGPGDDEDYVTPERPPPSKRARLADDDDGSKDQKGVKWDKGLSTSVFMDEIQLRDLKARREALAVKSCLAPAAKALNLDKLGNVVDEAAIPMQIAPENVVVKKIVYDSDIAPVVVEPLKNTRSRKKKS